MNVSLTESCYVVTKKNVFAISNTLLSPSVCRNIAVSFLLLSFSKLSTKKGQRSADVNVKRGGC